MASVHYLVVSGLGADRPGLVADVTAYLTARGANIEDSRMAVLGAEFGILILVSGAAEAIGRVREGLSELEKKTGLGVVVRATKSPEEHRKAPAMPCLVVAEALDHEGIVKAVAAALHHLGLNIVSLETIVYNAPVTGSPLFRLEAQVDLPRAVTVAQVRDALTKVAETENIDLEVRSLVGR